MITNNSLLFNLYSLYYRAIIKRNNKFAEALLSLYDEIYYYIIVKQL